jgi:hypothetical protein
LAADFGQQLGRVGLVEQDGARRPAIGKGEPVEIVEDAGRGRGREADNGEDAQMRRRQARLQPAGQRLVGEQRVEIDRRFGHADAVPFGRDGRMEIGQRLAVIEPAAFRHEAVEQRQHAIGAVDEAAQDFLRIDAGALAALIEPGFGARGVLGRRQIE